MIHDLLRDMGREIVRENARGQPEKFSRLWKHEDVIDVLSYESGTEEIEGVALELGPSLHRHLARLASSSDRHLARSSARFVAKSSDRHLARLARSSDRHLARSSALFVTNNSAQFVTKNSDRHLALSSAPGLTRFSAQAFTNMKKLRLLCLRDVELTGEYKDFPKKLMWLSWQGFPLESIPDDFPMQPKLVALDLQFSKLKIVWKDCKLHQNLKFLNLSYSRELTKSPDFSKLPNLEELILTFCVHLSEVHSSIGDLGRLSLVNLERCRMLRDLPLNFYKSKSIETLILNRCTWFEDLADGLGDLVSLTILKADNTRIRQIPYSIVKLKKLRILSLSGCWELTEDAIPKDLCGLISLEDLLLGRNEFHSLPSLAGLSKLKVLCLNACRELRAIPDLPTNLYILKANGCPKLETIPDFSKMSNMRELYLRDSFKLTEVPGLDKSLNSMTRIHMEGCTKLTADFRNNIQQRWTSSGFGGIYLNGIYDIPEWFKIVNDVDFFEVPQRIMGRDLKGLTICFVYSSDRPKLEDSQGRTGIIVRNLTKQTALRTWIAFASVKTSSKPEDHYLWQGQLSNYVLGLEGGDHVSILVRPDDVDFVRVKKTGVHLEWDKVMKENMDNPDRHLYDWETNGDFSGGVDDSISRNRENKRKKIKEEDRIV